MATLDDRLAALAAMSPAEVQANWIRTFRTTPPAVGHRLLALAIAHRWQEQALGGLSSRHKRELARLGERFAKTGEIDADAGSMLKVGTRLVREWHGQVHQVLICERGYEYRDRSYGSLSQIAREITGTSWSGPRFFGLKRRTKVTGGETAHG